MGASNNRDHARNLSYYCLLTPRIYIFVLRAHPVHGESHNQHNVTREVATTSPPFYNEPHLSHVLFVKAAPGTTFHILVTAPFCCDRKSRATYAQSFAPWQQATIEIMRRDLPYYCLLAPRIYIFVLRAHPIRGESHNQRNVTREVATALM